MKIRMIQADDIIMALEKTVNVQRKIIDELKFLIGSKLKYNTRVYVTNREYEIASLISQGLNSKEISNRLGIKYTTVRTHINKIYSLIEKQFPNKQIPHSLTLIVSMFLEGYIGRKTRK